MSLIDFSWFRTDSGAQVLKSVRNSESNGGRLRRFGLLEKPTPSAPYSSYDEVSYKIMLVGRAFCGKTSFIEALSQSKTSNKSSEQITYAETPGIVVTNFYWPIKLQKVDKLLMFKLNLWDVGKTQSIKYDYILPSSTNNLDCFLFIFSWTDKQSFLDVYESITNIYNSNDPHTQNEKNLPKLIIGTKFDQIVHSEIDQDLIDELETLSDTKIIRFSSTNCSFDQIQLVMNRLCDTLWSREQRLVALKK